MIKWWDEHLERVLMVIFYSYFCTIIFVEVVLRYVFNMSTGWGEMTARYAFVFLASIAVAEAARHNNHIRIDIVPRMLGHRARLALYLYFDLLQLVLGGLIVFYAIRVMGIQWDNQQMTQSLDVNVAFAYLALPLGWGLFVFRVLRKMMADWRMFRSTGTVAVGGEGFGV